MDLEGIKKRHDEVVKELAELLERSKALQEERKKLVKALKTDPRSLQEKFDHAMKFTSEETVLKGIAELVKVGESIDDYTKRISEIHGEYWAKKYGRETYLDAHGSHIRVSVAVRYLAKLGDERLKGTILYEKYN